MQTWLGEALVKEVPRDVQGVINRTVPALVDEQICTDVTPVIDDVAGSLVERELRAVLDPGDHLIPFQMGLQTAIKVAFQARLANSNPNDTVVEAPPPPTTAAVPINLIRAGTEDTRPRQVHMPPNPEAGPHPEDPPIYLPELQSVTRGLSGKDRRVLTRRTHLCTFQNFRVLHGVSVERTPRRMVDTEGILAMRQKISRDMARESISRLSDTCQNPMRRGGLLLEEEEEYSREKPYGDGKAVRQDYPPYRSRAGAHRRGRKFPSYGRLPYSISDEGRRHPGIRRDRSY